MADLKAMMARQRALRESAVGLNSPEPAQPEPAQPEPAQPEPPAEELKAKPKFAGNLANRFSKPSAAPKPATTAAPDESIDDMDLSDLANLESPAPTGLRPAREQFADETPATAPSREIPADADKQMLQFVELMDQVYGLIYEPELLGNVIRSIMIELKSHPQYMKQVAKEDVRLWVKAMRDSMGLARIKKQESKTKRAPGSAKSGKAIDKDMLDAFNELGVDLDNV